MLNLVKLLDYDHIVIQCHDDPDADTIASGFGVYSYLKAHGKAAELIYTGRSQITKPNLKMMVKSLHIPLKYVQELPKPDLLITVDSQLNGGNVTFIEANHYCSIDHHILCGDEVLFSDIRPYLGSCATLVWDLLREANFQVNEDINVATALYYGLFTDTNNFSELTHPLDKDMVDTLKYDASIIRELKACNLSMADLETAGIALLRCSVNAAHNFAVCESRPCDPNILGFISDLAIQVENILTCIVYFEGNEGIKFSVRSCTKEVKANEFALYVAKGIGSGGGNIDKAGGFIIKKAFIKQYPSVNVETYFHNITREYFENFDVLYANEYKVDLNQMNVYRKNKEIVGYTSSLDIFKEGTPIRIRTLEGDLDFVASKDTYIMVGVEGEAYPIQKEKFKRSYKPADQTFNISFQYTPIVKNTITGKEVLLTDCIKTCESTNSAFIYARPLEKNVKIFTLEDREQYISGMVGDYLAVRQDDPQDIYVIRKDIFLKSYSAI